MRYLVVLASFCIIELVKAGDNFDIDSAVSIATRSHTLHARGSGERNQNIPSSPVGRSSRPSNKPPTRAQSANNSSGRRSRSPSPARQDSKQSPSERANKSPRISPHAVSPHSTRRNNSPVSPTREVGESASHSVGNQPASAPAAADLPPAPTRIRTNSASQSHRRQQNSELPPTARYGQLPSPDAFTREQLMRTRAQQALQDPTTAKATAILEMGQGSVMSSRLPRAGGPAVLTADAVLGSQVKTVTSPYHTYVMATNNLPSGRTSARATGESIVKGRVDSMDRNGVGTLRAVVPGRSETKATIRGVGHIELEATNHHPTAGHARIQADYAGYGYVEAQGAQDGWRQGPRQGQLQVPQPLHPDNQVPQDPHQLARGEPSASGMRRNSAESGLSSEGSGRSRRRRQGSNRTS